VQQATSSAQAATPSSRARTVSRGS
jgi:hypothetical protein